jgi:hypothetical protein
MAEFMPEGYEVGKPVVAVTYKLDRVEGLTTLSEMETGFAGGDFFTYNSNVGYEVYQLTIDA